MITQEAGIQPELHLRRKHSIFILEKLRKHACMQENSKKYACLLPDDSYVWSKCYSLISWKRRQQID